MKPGRARVAAVVAGTVSVDQDAALYYNQVGCVLDDQVIQDRGFDVLSEAEMP